MTARDAAGLTDILDDLEANADGEALSVGDIVAAFRYRSFGPLILAPAIIAVLPTGALPGVPTTMALCIMLVAGQLLVGRQHAWLPRTLKERWISRESFCKAFTFARRYTRFIDRFIHPRLDALTTGPVRRLVAGVCVMLALTMIPLELVPFAGAIPGLSILLLALGMSTEDGLLVLLGLLGAGLAIISVGLLI